MLNYHKQLGSLIYQSSLSNSKHYRISLSFSIHYFNSATKDSSKVPLISIPQRNVTWNFKSMDSSYCELDCLLIQNNSDYNQKWLQKIIPQTQTILLADGGANIFYEKVLQKGSTKQTEQFLTKIKGIVGDLDSVSFQTRDYFQQHNVPLVKITDQNKNDFQKTLLHGLSLGCKNFIVSGAFGNRLDHTLSTMSITEHYIKKYLNINIILSNSTYLYCPLRTGYSHKVLLSSDISHQQCGLVTFQKIKNIQTKGFRWNIGKEQEYHSLEWGKFLSTSNQIVGDEVTIDTKEEQKGLIYLLMKFKDAPE